MASNSYEFHILITFARKNKLVELFNPKRIDFHIIISILIPIILLGYRFDITGNPFYPFLAEYIVPSNSASIEFEKLVWNYERDGFFPFSLIIPKNISYLGMALGPATACILPYSILSNLKKFDLFSISLISIYFPIRVIKKLR